MKFKTQEENVEVQIDVNKEECSKDCPICQSLNIALSQIDLMYSILSSLRTSIETVVKMHEKHDSE